jgi:hypothetical protein
VQICTVIFKLDFYPRMILILFNLSNVFASEISNNIQREILNFQMIKLHLRRSQPILVKGWLKPANSFTMMQSL